MQIQFYLKNTSVPVIKIAEKVNEKRDNKWWVSVFYNNIENTRIKLIERNLCGTGSSASFGSMKF